MPDGGCRQTRNGTTLRRDAIPDQDASNGTPDPSTIDTGGDLNVHVRVMGDEAAARRVLALLGQLVELTPVEGPWTNRRQPGVRLASHAVRERPLGRSGPTEQTGPDGS